MKLTSSLSLLIVLISTGFCAADTTTVNPVTENTTATVNPVTETTTTTVNPVTETTTTTVNPVTETTTTEQTGIVTSTTSTPPTSHQPDTTTFTPSTSTNPPITSSTEQTTITTTVNPITSTTSTTSKPVITTSIKPVTSTTTSLPVTVTSSMPTTVPPATTTKSPDPPTPEEGSWNVTEGKMTCIRANLKIRFKIPVKDHEEYIILSPNATSSGSCESSNTTQELKLEESAYTLTMLFEKDSINAYLKKLTFTYTLHDSSGTAYNDDKLFTVKLGNSYLCDSKNDINLQNATMEVFSIHIQSFGKAENKDFGTAEKCEAVNKAYDKVPIAVGIVLLILTVVVLVAYFVQRRWSSQKAYQNV